MYLICLFFFKLDFSKMQKRHFAVACLPSFHHALAKEKTISMYNFSPVIIAHFISAMQMFNADRCFVFTLEQDEP